MGKREKKRIKGNNLKPRLTIFRSNKHIYAQVIDDLSSKTILSCSTLEAEVKALCEKTWNKKASKIVGKVIAKKLLKENIQKVIFDRGKRIYHGRVKELAEGARLGGLIF